MGLGGQVKSHVVESAVLRFFQWRGDPVARLRRPGDEGRPVSAVRPVFASVGLVRSPLGLWSPPGSRNGGGHPAGPAVQQLTGAPARLPAAVLPAGRPAGRAARR